MPKRPPQRRATDRGNTTRPDPSNDFATWKKVLASLAAGLVLVVPTLYWFISTVAVGIAKDRDDAVMEKLNNRMTTQWAQFYTKAEIDARRIELDRRYDETRAWMIRVDAGIAAQTVILEHLRAQQELETELHRRIK